MRAEVTITGVRPWTDAPPIEPGPPRRAPSSGASSHAYPCAQIEALAASALASSSVAVVMPAGVGGAATSIQSGGGEGGGGGRDE